LKLKTLINELGNEKISQIRKSFEKLLR